MNPRCCSSSSDQRGAPPGRFAHGRPANAQPSSKKKPPAASPTQSAVEFERANQLLKRMAESTGGRAYFPAAEKEFNLAYAEIAQLVRHEYSLAFAPPERDGTVHFIRVRVGTPQALAPLAASYRIDHRRRISRQY